MPKGHYTNTTAAGLRTYISHTHTYTHYILYICIHINPSDIWKHAKQCTNAKTTAGFSLQVWQPCLIRVHDQNYLIDVCTNVLEFEKNKVTDGGKKKKKCRKRGKKVMSSLPRERKRNKKEQDCDTSPIHCYCPPYFLLFSYRHTHTPRTNIKHIPASLPLPSLQES